MEQILQSSTSHQTSTIPEEPHLQQISAAGTIQIKSNGNEEGEMSVSDLQVTMQSGEMEPFTQKMPVMTLQGFTEDSRLSAALSTQSGGADKLFALPAEKLAVGQSYTVPAESPFNAMGSLLIVTGETTTSIPQLVTINDRTCAQIIVTTLINQLDIPDNLEGEYKYHEQSIAILYFDIQRQQFVEGNRVSLLHFSIDAPNPQPQIDGDNKSSIPERTILEMKSETLLEYTIIH